MWNEISKEVGVIGLSRFLQFCSVFCLRTLKWFKKSAEQGNADAQNSLGDMYHLGDGVKRQFCGKCSRNNEKSNIEIEYLKLQNWIFENNNY